MVVFFCMVVLWWGGGGVVSSHSLDGVGSDELRKTAPLHCKGGGLSERDLRRGKPSVVVEICCRGRLLPSSRRASLRATLLPRQSFFWWALNFSWTFSLRSELVVKCNISIFDFFVSVSLWLWWLLKWHAPTKLLSDPSSLRPKHNNLKM